MWRSLAHADSSVVQARVADAGGVQRENPLGHGWQSDWKKTTTGWCVHTLLPLPVSAKLEGPDKTRMRPREIVLTYIHVGTP